MAQVQVSKAVGYVVTGDPGASISSSKIVAYIVMVPGDDGSGGSGGSGARWGFVTSNITRRLRR